ncbi:MAG: translation initiation factor IF-2 [Chitinispirillia bacterium]|jgi:translation initiation factor IF-2
MAKEKVYKLAKEFKVSSEALVQILREMGIAVKSHMSIVDEDLRDQIKQKFEQERSEIKKQYARKKRKIARAKEEFQPKSLKEKKVGVVTAATKKGVKEEIPIAPKADTTVKEKVTTKTASTLSDEDIVVFTPQKPVSPELFEKTNEIADDSDISQGKRAVGKKAKRKSGKGKTNKPLISQAEMKANIKKTLAKIGAGSTKKKYKKDTTEKITSESDQKKILNVSEFVTVNELANMMGLKVSEVIAKCLELGLFVTINHRLDFDTIELVADEFDFTAKLMSEYASEDDINQEDTSNCIHEPRSPVVTIMGHVDHGKTSVLDYIRKTNVIAGEAGGITQHIAAYEVTTEHGNVTFLDTPGHEAFTAMRARGSQVTDVVVLVVAADSGVMPQTKEAIDHAKAANVPIVVAINKIDLPTANVDKIKGELAQYGLVVSDYGCQISCVEISAKTGAGIDKLLEILALETEILELKATKEGNARGVVIESELDKGKGAIATVLIQQGTLYKGSPFVTGIHFGKVRDLFNERGISTEKAGPSQPVVVLGLSGTPQAGDSFKVVNDEKVSREISGRRRLAQQERELRKIGSLSLEHLYEAIQEGQMQTLNIIIKGDVDGSVEALSSSLEKLSTDEIKINVIHKSVGAIKETDVNLATASNAIIIGFHLNPNSKIREMAKRERVDIRTYRIIYEAVNEMRDAMEGMLAPEIKEKVVGNAEIRQIFKISKIGTIAGCMVTSGNISRNGNARLIRDDIEIVDTKITTLKRLKDDVKEVQNGYECGLTLNNFTDFKEGDRIEVYEKVEIARKLERKE